MRVFLKMEMVIVSLVGLNVLLVVILMGHATKGRGGHVIIISKHFLSLMITLISV
jgi:hypothetical protein